MSRTDYALLAACTLILADGLITLPHWQLEANPVVLAIGPAGMVSIKIVAVAGLLYVWFRGAFVQRYRIANACVWGLLVLHAAVVVTNLVVLTVVA